MKAYYSPIPTLLASLALLTSCQPTTIQPSDRFPLRFLPCSPSQTAEIRALRIHAWYFPPGTQSDLAIDEITGRSAPDPADVFVVQAWDREKNGTFTLALPSNTLCVLSIETADFGPFHRWPLLPVETTSQINPEVCIDL